MSLKESGFATKAIHYGYSPKSHEGALIPPVHFTSTFAFENVQQGAELFAGERQGHVYSRISNPTLELLEKRLAALESAEAGVSFASGMGAVTSTLWTFLRPGDEIITDKTLYGCTFGFLNHGLAEFGVKVTHIDMSDLSELRNALNHETKIVYFETPANPNMKLVDIEGVVQKVNEFKSRYFKSNIRVIVDNTYSTPFLTNPLLLGADLVLHSATKYLGGHGDLVAGICVGNKEDIQAIRLIGLKDMTGAALAPMTAMLIMRGLKTLSLRMQKHSENGFKVARYLEVHPEVTNVNYPGLETFSQHNLAKRQMKLFGGMLTFELKGGLCAGSEMMDNLNLIQRAVSLGDSETLIQHPASMTHSTYTPEERIAHDIKDGLVRLSVGLEDIEDIISDLDQALGQIQKWRRLKAI